MLRESKNNTNEEALIAIEAKAAINADELMAGTSMVNRAEYDAGRTYNRIVDYREEVAAGMGYIEFFGNVDGEGPRVRFHNYKEPEFSRDSLKGNPFGALIKPDADIQIGSMPVRVSCSCANYKLLFSRANKSNDAHIGHLPNTTLDPRDYGFKKRSAEELNPDSIPGMCRHQIALVRSLVATNRASE